MADNDIKEEFHVDNNNNNNLEASCKLTPLMAMEGDDGGIYEQFSVDQETPLDLWIAYVRFIERLRVRLGVVGTRRTTHGLPVLSPRLSSSIKWMILRLRANKRHLNLFIRQDNLTLIGFQRQMDDDILELGYTGSPHLIHGSTFIEVTHSYPDLLQKAELDTVGDIKLGQPQLIRAIFELNRATALKIRSYHLIVIMQMICESIKFSRISDHLATIFGPGSGSGPPLWMDHLIKSWHCLSAAFHRVDTHPDHRLPSNKMGFKSFAEAINAFGIVQNYNFNRHHPLSAVGGGNYYDYDGNGKSLFGQPKVEVTDVRINKINGENPEGNLYGTIIIRDGLISQYLYNRMRDQEEIIHPGDSVILIGPTQSVSGYDSFTIDVDLKDKKETYEESLDTEVCKGHVLCNLANDEYGIVHMSNRIDGKHGSVTVNFMVLGDAVEATVEVRLLYADDKDPANVYGVLTARNSESSTETVLFRKPSTEFVKVSPRNEAIPLSRSVVAVPSDAYLIVTADLKHSDDDHQIAEGSATFSTQLSGSVEKHVKGLHGDIIVKVTWAS